MEKNNNKKQTQARQAARKIKRKPAEKLNIEDLLNNQDLILAAGG